MSRTPARRPEKAMPAGLDLSSLPSISPADIVDEGADALVRRGAAYVREYAQVENKPTILLLNIAAVLIALRQQHTTDDGRTDWLGRSGPYRRDAGAVYVSAGVTEETRERISRAVRWHVGNLMREVLTADQLAEYELQESSPLERLQDQRATTSAIVAAARAEVTAQTVGVPTVRATADHMRLGTAVTNILGQMSPEVIRETMTDGQRAKLDAELAEAQQKLRILRRYTRGREPEA